MPATKRALNNQLSDVHSSSATRSRLGSDASSASTAAGSTEGAPLCSGTINCGWTDMNCGKEAATLMLPALLSDTTTVDAGSKVTLPCSCSVFICPTDTDDAGTLDAMLNISTGITICLQKAPKVSWLSVYIKCHHKDSTFITEIY